MAKNSVTDWSTNDSLNTDIGSTNIAEGCAPSGINDAIRKIMAQIASFIANITLGNTTINGTLAVNTPTATITDAQMPKVDLVRNGVGTWHVGGSGVAGDNSFNLTLNATTPSLKIDTGGAITLTAPQTHATGAVRAGGTSVFGSAGAGVELLYNGTTGTVAAYDRGAVAHKQLALQGSTISLTPSGNPGIVVNASGVVTDLANGFAVSSSDPANYNVSRSATTTVVKGAGNVALSVAGTVTVNTTGVLTTISNPLLVNGTTTIDDGFRTQGTSSFGGTGAGLEMHYNGGAGSIQSYNRAGIAYTPLSLLASNINLSPQGGGVVTVGAQTNQQGILTLGGAALGGVSGQILFNTAAGASNIANIGWQAGNEFRIANTTNGTVATYVNGASRFSVTSAVTSTTNLFVASSVSRAGLTTVGAGAVQIVQGDSTHSGYLEFLNTAGSSIGYIQQTIGGRITYTNSSGGGHNFVGGPAFFGSDVQASGQVLGITPGFGTSGGLRTCGSGAGGPAIVQFTNNDSTNEWVSIIADPAGNKVTIVVGHVAVFSIDSGGNVRCAGTITQNVVI